MKRFRKLLSVLLSVVLILSTFGGMQIQAATPDTRYSHKYLQNGGFEENAENYKFSSYYTQPFKANVPYWDTTAYGNDGKNGMFEFFKAGAAHFNLSSKDNRVVAEREVAAELNADEVSTIYQRIETVSGSTYTWGLDHRGRDTTDTMVLFIGPEQYDESGNVIDPSKPSKTGQDQFVKMTDWLKTQYGVSYPKTGCSQKYTIYSKPFDKNGKFLNESAKADENFSMTKTAECNQEWNLWVISSSNENKDPDTTKAIKGWSKYGTNCYNENDDSYNDVINGAGSKLGYDCTYTVPKGQTKTLFAFTSYSSGRLINGSITPERTFGNLLDDINFKLYQPISSSITDGGTGGANVGNATITNDIQNGNMFYTTVNDGNECTIHTKVTDGDTGHVFQGAYVTVFDDAGNPTTKFVEVYPKNTSGLTEEEMLELSKTYFMPDDYYQHEGGERWDFFYTVKVDSPVHIHMMYTKAPYVLYDSNGGEPYQWTQDNSVGGNLVGFSDSFKGLEGVNSKGYYEDVIVKTIDNDDGTVSKEITPGFYKSHAALPNSKWLTNDSGVGSKFLGWTFNYSSTDGSGVTTEKIVTVAGEHTVTYAPNETEQGAVTISDSNNNISGLTLDASNGITLTAQWQFGYTAQAQTLLGHALETQTYENSDVGGWVEETFINDRSNVTDHKADYTPNRTERTDAYGSVGEKIIFRATPDSANNYVFDGWYTKESDGSYKLVTTAPTLAITVEEGKSTTYYARFKTKTVPVIFHYSASGSKDDYVYYDADADNKYGKYFQEVVYNKKAIKPTGDSKKVTMWFTSPTERSVEKLFNFNTPITKETHLYASPSFGFNFFNHFEFTEPRAVDTYATVKVNGKYIDLKNDTDVTDYNIYISKGALGDTAPNSTEIKTMSGVKKYGKKINSGSIIFNSTTTVGQRFNRIGVTYADLEMQTMRFPVWVNFDFTYKGIQYTAPVYDRSLYNNIQMYKLAENQQYYTSYPKDAQDDVKALHEATVDTLVNLADTAQEANLGEPTAYAVSCDVDGLVFDEASANENYTFSSSTAVRNIEPWGFKYSFSVNEKNVTDFDDYGAVVLTDNDSKYDSNITVSDIINDSNSVMFSFGKDNVYLSDDEQSIEVYYCENITSDNFDKITYVVFFVKDGDSYYYSSVVANSYNEILDKDVDNTFAPLIRNYSQTYKTYINTIAEYDKKYGEA